MRFVQFPVSCPQTVGPVRRSSPALLVGPSVVRRTLTHHSHAAVFRHDTLTFSEHRPLGWEGTWHYTLHERSSDISRQIREWFPWTTRELGPLHVSRSRSCSWSWSPEGPHRSLVVLHHIKWPKHPFIQIVASSLVRR